MARVADYSIIADAWVLERDQDTIMFDVPATINKESRSVLSFMLQTGHLEDMSLTIRLNGTEVWNWRYGGNCDHTQFFQEVVASGVVKAGTNKLRFVSSSDDARFVQLSDIVLLWQANI
jgi:hypothetical protein